MFNVQQITARLATMSDAQLQQYARMHKDDPYILPLAAAEAKRRQQTRQAAMGQQAAQQATQPTIADKSIASMQLPEEQGIGVLPAQNIEGMADGGIAGYKEGGVPQAEREKYRAYALRKARELGLDPKFVDAIFQIESGYNPTAKSKTGPEGIGQLAKKTGLAKGLKPEERKDPYKNMDAAMALMQDFFKKYKDPAKVAIAYNQGEGVLNDHLKQNKGKLVPEKLHENVRTRNKQEPLNYLKKLNNYIPIPAAAAADVVPRGEFKSATSPGAPAARGVTPLPALPKEPTAAPAPAPAPAPAATAAPTPDLRFKDVPGHPDAIEYERQLRAGRGPERSYLAQRGRELLGAPEAALSAATGAISPLTGTLYAAGRTLAGTPTTAEEGFGATTFAPRSEYGKESLAEMYRAFEDFKIPPFIPGVGTTSARPKAGKAVTAAELAEAEAARAAQAVETAKAPRLEGPKPEGAAGRTSDLQRRFAEAQERSAKALETADLLATSVVDGKLMTGKEKAAALRASMPKTEGFTPDPAAQQVGIEAVLARKRAQQAKDVMRAKEDAAKAARKAEEAAVIAERERALDRGDKTFADARRQAEANRNVFAPGVIGTAVTPGAVSETPERPPVSDAYPDETLRGIKPKPDVEEARRVAETVAPTEEVKPKTGGLTNEDYLTMGLNMMMAQPGQPGGALSQLASNIGRSGIATLQARREREKLAREEAYRDITGGYYKKLTEMYGRPELEERQIAEIRKANPGMTYLQAVEELNRAKYAARAESAEEIARYRNPFGMLLSGGYMEPSGSLSPQGQAIFNQFYPKQ
jgi:soluble lytic murein transglycosylase-like protein